MQRFLLVDNAAAVRLTLADQLRVVCGANLEVQHAESGKEALAACARQAFDAVFIGLGLAGGERGLPAVEAILGAHPRLPLILCTSMPREHPDVAAALSAGAVAYLPKPTRADTVRKALEGVPSIAGHLRRIP
ncbi:MAG: Response regulator receiver domain [Thermoplasmata archaeon]|nr:Response regulator receiver domain [Thermoplasmata archaeon]